MPQGGLCREALGISALNGVRYGHSHCKQKAGEYNIRQSHKILTIDGMFQPMGYVMHFQKSLTKIMMNMVNALSMSMARLRRE